MYAPVAGNEECLAVYCTTPDKASAESMGETLVRERLAACVNIVEGITSLYWWGGSVTRDNECACILKTTRGRYAKLEARIRELHTYDVPCIVAVPVTLGNPAFLDWVRAETNPFATA